MKLRILFVSAFVAALTEGIHLAAFNIRSLGVTKMSKPKVVDYLVKIINRYDLIVIQELRDKSGKAILDLLDAVNAYSSDEYDMILGSRVGRSTYKEQYVFMYNPSVLTMTGYFEYLDKNDKFEREPMTVRFQPTSNYTEQKDFAVMAIHAKPDYAKEEINYLADVYDDVIKLWNIEDVAIVGDFNADCTYVRRKDWSEIQLQLQSRFHWLIPNETDTTVSQSTRCAYDRLVVTGNLVKTVQAPSVFYFDSYFGLSTEEAGDISDHYPIEMIIV